MSCKYNLDEFKPFTSGKKRIKPAVTDDWHLIADGGFQGNTGVAIQSKKLDCTIFDISLNRF
jgi:hypothetical protein